jgi:hypothetical protein
MPRMFVPPAALPHLVEATQIFADLGNRRAAAILDEVARRLTAATTDWREVDTFIAPAKVIPLKRGAK